MKTLIFDIWGEFGHFRRFFTTSSPLTHSFPIPSTVRGIIGAILGLEKDKYISETNKFDIAVRVLKPISKVRMGLNYVDTKETKLKINKKIENRTQVFVEFLKNPKFRIYVGLGNEGDPEGVKLFERLCDRVKNKENVYTVSLGLAQLLAEFEFVDLGNAEFVDSSYVVHSVIPVDKIENIKPGNIKISKERIPFFLKEGRVPGFYNDVVVEVSGSKLEGSFRDIFKIYYRDKGNNIEDFVYFFGVKELVSS